MDPSSHIHTYMILFHITYWWRYYTPQVREYFILSKRRLLQCFHHSWDQRWSYVVRQVWNVGRLLTGRGERFTVEVRYRRHFSHVFSHRHPILVLCDNMCDLFLCGRNSALFVRSTQFNVSVNECLSGPKDHKWKRIPIPPVWNHLFQLRRVENREEESYKRNKWYLLLNVQIQKGVTHVSWQIVILKPDHEEWHINWIGLWLSTQHKPIVLEWDASEMSQFLMWVMRVTISNVFNLFFQMIDSGMVCLKQNRLFFDHLEWFWTLRLCEDNTTDFSRLLSCMVVAGLFFFVLL